MARRGTTVGVLGCGLIGRSWAALFACYGHDVIAWDPEERALEGFAESVAEAQKQVRRVRQAPRDEGHVQLATSLEEATSDVFWIQENAPESLKLKLDLYRRIERSTSDDTIVASSTSSFRWSELAPSFARPQRFITAHPFNPPHLMPLVEIFAADIYVLSRALEFYQDMEREAVVLKRDATGHIANRLQSALWREALNILSEEIADVASIDRALVHGPGLRWSLVGAFMASHLGGGAGGIQNYLRHLGPSQERRWASLGTPRLTPELCERLTAGVLEEAVDCSIKELEAERDARLIRVMLARRKA